MRDKQEVATDRAADYRRFGVIDGEARQSIAFFLPDTFGMLPFIAAVEPLRAANRFSGQALYQWTLLGTSTADAIANNGMKLAVDREIGSGDRFDRVIVCGPHEPLSYKDSKALRALRQYAAQGSRIGALDTGSYLLAQADLIRHRRCTIHWENMPGFREAFPHIAVTSELFEEDEGLFTCAGGTAALDMMLAIIRQDHGSTLALQVADLFISTRIRAATDPQRRSIVERSGIHHAGLVSCIELMEVNLEQPIATSELAEMVGLSSRQLERLFRTYLQTTPTLHYQALRLKAGRELLRQTTLSVMDVATAVGFASADYFSRRFRRQFGCSPTEARRRDDKV
ncbi:GlxA family transcriptional regulator [Granulosicoccus sp. 3-233]|uniref:GlxA family transcriptional regulator n=1 Tax=Granulosicoccus sp. 3-233 TaxID=3417969 RepID=UPI003D352BBA